MHSELTQLEQLEQLLLERRKCFIALNETTAQHLDDLPFFMTNERLLSHYDQLIDIVRQAIAIGSEISPENRKEITALSDQLPVPLEKKTKI